MNSTNNTHLKCLSNGRVFLYSDVLATRDDMVPCDAQGNIAQGHISESDASVATQERRKTPFLGNMANGVLYPWSDTLATRDDMISIDTEEQWNSMQAKGDAPPQAPSTVAPTLTRSNNDVPHETPGDTAEHPETPQEQPSIQLPNIEGLGAREAKTELAAWASKNFKHKLNRKPALDAVLKECQGLIDGTIVAKAG